MASDDDDNNRLPFINPRYTLGIITKEGGKALAVVRKGMTVVSVAIDAYRVGRAVHTDYTATRKRRPGKRTIRASASVASGWTDSNLGRYIGGGIGTMFGGVGAVPVGIIGGIVGSYVGKFTGEKVVDKYVSSDSEGEDEDEDEND
jgi:hypothetical protein